MQSEYDQAGLGFDAAGTRVARLAEAVTIIKGCSQARRSRFAGQHYHVTGHRIHPLPVQRPHLPLLIGGNGQQLLTSPHRKRIWSASRASPYDAAARRRIFAGWKRTGIEERMQLIREAAGDRYDRLELNALVQRSS